MYQKFSTDLSTQEIYASGNELACFVGKIETKKAIKYIPILKQPKNL